MLSFFVLSVLLLIALTAASVMIYEIRMSLEISNSGPAFFAADAGAEKCLYQARLETGECSVDGGSTSIALDNGASAVATRATLGRIVSAGNFNGAKRQVELSW